MNRDEDRKKMTAIQTNKGDEVTCTRVSGGFTCKAGGKDLGKFKRVMWRDRDVGMWQDATVGSPQYKPGESITIKHPGIIAECWEDDGGKDMAGNENGKTMNCIESLR